ncbi:hypothetical protein NEPAR06_0053 [Nematocida parisii]|uniref:Uncharacterized protein n=1 Tax=Nematocida parisii (strain ERTm3) TaxID=935791 RepID=I3EE20_NEMP3|nr:uncharacterized protein NEPG_00069 [Nematocida parisii ERTm1]EIJ87467.1 hypothetical protein NEQG_02348 [Nematocida parisii ERTm3]KAI5142743.1 hypothetical protein NEPAR07_0269 [Nematocida parisii]EIJ94547.1 hypothetical protein NEPG_00069 [Nematocida parisii ERTm1]KAI5152932.1 hypothetical protein NEPAR06_0053 [Nematocida parisii]KAI5157455.1 hypothetical protein NEPAR05_1294 [Nematocida parisii]|eukprot:XP_013057903.1 hypothetical protein NEPG_00069 [Nematocida parisii ERTm1]
MISNRKELLSEIENQLLQLSNKQESPHIDHNDVVAILVDTYKKKAKLDKKYLPLNNLIQTTFMSLLYNNIDRKAQNTTSKTRISEITNILCNTEQIITSLMEMSEEIKNKEQRTAYYNMMNTTHLFMMKYPVVSCSVKETIKEIISGFCGGYSKNENIKEDEAILDLLELNESKGYSRLQRVLEIVTTFESMQIRENKNDRMESFGKQIKLTKDDFYSFHLFLAITPNSSKILKKLIESFKFIKTSNDLRKSEHKYIYDTLFFFLVNQQFQPVDVDNCRNLFKASIEVLEALSGDVYANFSESEMESLLKEHNITPSTFKLNIIRRFGQSIKNQLDAIFSRPIGIKREVFLDRKKEWAFYTDEAVHTNYNMKIPEATLINTIATLDGLDGSLMPIRSSEVDAKKNIWRKRAIIIALILLIVAAVLYSIYSRRAIMHKKVAKRWW